MTEPILLQFINEVGSNYNDYCVICLRTSTERRLEKPKYLNKFLQSINKSGFIQKHQLICFLCERQAAAAFRFLSAANLAIQAHNVMQCLQINPEIRTKFNSKFYTHDFQNHITTDNIFPTRVGTVADALDCEARLQRQRIRSQLLQTDVLLVSTPSLDTQDSNEPAVSTSMVEIRPALVGSYTGPLPPRPGESSDLYVIPDETPSKLQLVADSEIKMESVIIYDDDDPIQTTKETQTNNKKKDTPKRKVDKIIKAVPIESLIDKPDDENSELKEMATSANFVLHPIVFNSGMMNVPSLSATIISGQLMTSNDSKIVVETPKIALQIGENIDFIADPVKVTGILSKLSHQNVSKVFILTTPGPEVDMLKNLNAAGSDKNLVVNKTVKVKAAGNKSSEKQKASVVKAADAKDKGKKANAPMLRSDRIDWEDKIPMDLISFVDADENSSKRPRREERVSPALGFISNVTSLIDEPPYEIIDLC